MGNTSVPARTRLGGDDLRLLRLVRHVTAASMAPHYGATPNAVTNIERTIRPRPDTVSRYLRALAAAATDRDAQ